MAQLVRKPSQSRHLNDCLCPKLPDQSYIFSLSPQFPIFLLDMFHVFVYGTLKPGEVSYRLCAKHVVNSQSAIVQGLLYALPLGYPAMTSGKGNVRGYVLSFTESSVLLSLDYYEQHAPEQFAHYAPGQSLQQNQYARKEIQTFSPAGQSLTTAWAYFMTPVQVRRLGGVLLKEGLWTPQKQTAAFNGRCLRSPL